jgi:dipeptidyl aminopeptidase/acylaminoacyl peptidase
MKSWIGRLLLAIWFVGMVVVAVRGTPVQGQVENGGEPKQYFPTMLRNAPVLAEPPLNGYLGLAVVGTDQATELYTLRADGSEVRRLTDNSMEEVAPKWSPGGQQIAYIQQTAEPFSQLQVMVMNRDGSGARVVGMAREGEGVELRWSPDERYLLVVFRDEVQQNLLAVLAVDGSLDYLVASHISGTPNPFAPTWQLGWSPTGAYLHYMEEGNLWTYEPERGRKVQIGEVLEDLSFTFPRILWHPHRGDLVFVTDDAEGVMVAPDGTNRQVLFEGDYEIGGWVDNNDGLLLMHRLSYSGGRALYILPLSGNPIVPFVVSKGDYGVEFGGISPAGDAVLYYDLYGTRQVVLHPLESEPHPIQGAGCYETGSGWCTLSYRVSWSANNDAVVFTMDYTDWRVQSYTVNYGTHQQNAYHTTKMRGLGGATLLPHSPTNGIAYGISSYPEPGLRAYHFYGPTGTYTQLVPELGNFVKVVEWRYMP